jgi:hypothetical protein
MDKVRPKAKRRKEVRTVYDTPGDPSEEQSLWHKGFEEESRGKDASYAWRCGYGLVTDCRGWTPSRSVWLVNRKCSSSAGRRAEPIVQGATGVPDVHGANLLEE